MAKKPKQCPKCNSEMIKKNSGTDIYYECNYCGHKEDKNA